MERTHPGGVFEAVVPGATSPSRGGLPRPDALRERRHRGARRSLPLRAGAHRLRPAPVRRGHATCARSRSSARTAIDDRARRRRALRGVGAERGARQRHRRLQRVGRPRAPDAAARAVGRLGDLHPRSARTASATSSRSARATGAPAQEDRSVRRALRGAAAAPRRSSARHRAATSGATRRGWRRAPRGGAWLERPMSIYEVHLGSWRARARGGQPLPDLPRAGATGSCRT